MAEEAVQQQVEEQQQEEVNWQEKYEAMRQHSREWEKRAKDNEAAASELEELKQAQLTEQEKANARAEKAEAEAAALRSEKERLEAARSIAEKSEVPSELLEFCSDAESMERFAEIYKSKQPTVHAAPTAQASRIVQGNEQPQQARDRFAALFGE